MGGASSEFYQTFRKQCFTAFLHLRRYVTSGIVITYDQEISFQVRMIVSCLFSFIWCTTRSIILNNCKTKKKHLFFIVFVCFFPNRHANLILNLFALMVDANVPDIALEPDKTVKKVSPSPSGIFFFIYNKVEGGRSIDGQRDCFLNKKVDTSNWHICCGHHWQSIYYQKLNWEVIVLFSLLFKTSEVSWQVFILLCCMCWQYFFPSGSR